MTEGARGKRRTGQVERGRNTRFGTNRGRLPDAFHAGKWSVVRRRHGLPLLCSGKSAGAERPQVQKQEIPMPHPMTPGFQHIREQNS
jgi:hypothetical protein